MSNGTRNIWMAALLALGLGAGELVAYQGIAPHAEALLSSGGHRAALEAGRIVARNLSGIVIARAQEAAGALALLGVKQTTRAYRLAERVLGVADPETGACGSAETCTGADRELEAVVASEPDVTCNPDLGCEAMAGAKLSCPACPACPERVVKVKVVRAPRTAAKLGRSGA
jgi:hypothetical protein